MKDTEALMLVVDLLSSSGSFVFFASFEICQVRFGLSFRLSTYPPMTDIQGSAAFPWSSVVSGHIPWNILELMMIAQRISRLDPKFC
jgi:hypothetical protein